MAKSVNLNTFSGKADDYVMSVIRFNDTYNIVTDDGDAVVMSGEEYRGMIETLLIKSVPGQEDKLMKAGSEQGECFDWRGEYRKKWK